MAKKRRKASAKKRVAKKRRPVAKRRPAKRRRTAKKKSFLARMAGAVTEAASLRRKLEGRNTFED
jgi:hypothetical protein